jgi:hypothetical protein
MSDTQPEIPNIPDAPPALRDLLMRLPDETGGFTIGQHHIDPRADEWYVGWNGGDIGPYNSAEAALMAGIKWLYSLYAEASAARQKADVEVTAPEERGPAVTEQHLDQWAEQHEQLIGMVVWLTPLEALTVLRTVVSQATEGNQVAPMLAGAIRGIIERGRSKHDDS